MWGRVHHEAEELFDTKSLHHVSRMQDDRVYEGIRSHIKYDQMPQLWDISAVRAM